MPGATTRLTFGASHPAIDLNPRSQALLDMAGVAAVEMDVPARRLRLTIEGADPDDIIDQADALGVFL